MSQNQCIIKKTFRLGYELKQVVREEHSKFYEIAGAFGNLDVIWMSTDYKDKYNKRKCKHIFLQDIQIILNKSKQTVASLENKM